MSKTPLERYSSDLSTNNFLKDGAQEAAIFQLQALYDVLLERYCREAGKSLLRRALVGLASALAKPFAGKVRREPIRGLYFWGGVGRGKTYLMDIFYEALPFEEKSRTHFHRFMRRVHAELKLLRGQQNPLELVAEKLAGEVRIICFDEFFVSDITDAMILANLLEALFERGVTLVATSNIEPDGLYLDGLQRARFLPAITMLKRHTQVINVDGGVDYRLRTLEQAQLFHTPPGPLADAALNGFFEELAADVNLACSNVDVEIEGRKIRALKEAEDVVWFDFFALCDGPRSQLDYIELAREYHAVIVSGVPALGTANDDQARRFIYLVDEFYDRNVKLILSAERDVRELYGEGRAKFEFERTISRILEMQSREYLARPHRP
ncbi:MAG: cell division protein ZapE, partial [Lentisphaeria bacterium]